MNLQRKIDFAIKLLRNIPQDGPIELSYSGGKDSDVILELAKMAGIPFEAIYKNTTIDPPGTIQHAKEVGATIIKPKETFLQIVARKGIPSRWKRFCCSELKEYKIHDRAIQGIRREESTKRASRYHEPEECRLYPNGGKVRVYYPILEWSLEDVARFIEDRGIKLAPHYYDESGCPHYDRRLGCIGCPLKSDIGLADFEKYPRHLRNILRAYQKYLDNHVNSKSWRLFEGKSVNQAFYILFTKSTEEYLAMKTGGLFPDEAVDVKAFLENHFGIPFEI